MPKKKEMNFKSHVNLLIIGLLMIGTGIFISCDAFNENLPECRLFVKFKYDYNMLSTAMKKRNEEKAKILYDFLDQSEMFKGTVVKEDRSLMNVPFVTGDKDLDAKFVAEAKEAGFENLKGHRTVGGMRASIYNAMPKEGVEKLVAFMKKFEEENK